MNPNTDTGKFRNALRNAGFVDVSTWTVFNDRRRGDLTRRLKLWKAGAINDAPEAKQKELEALFKKEFGSRYCSGYFVPSPWNNNCSLCIVLKAE